MGAKIRGLKLQGMGGKITGGWGLWVGGGAFGKLEINRDCNCNERWTNLKGL